MPKYKYFIRQPKYYDEFHCIGGDCPATCCRNWGTILWRDDEYDKLMNAEMSDELRAKLTNAFVRTEHPIRHIPMWNIHEILKADGSVWCPLCDKEGLCSIQRELGAEYLSDTCMQFPREGVWSENMLTRNCVHSCVEVVRLLMTDKDAMKLTVREYVSAEKTLPFRMQLQAGDNEETFVKNPEKRYRNVLSDFFYSLVENPDYPPETGMVLGAIAAKRLTELCERKRFGDIPEEIKALKKALADPARAEQIAEIKPNYKVKLGVIGAVFLDLTDGRRISNALKPLLDEDGHLSVAKYERGRAALAQVMTGREYFFRNLALNLLLELRQPFYQNGSIYDNWLYYCACWSELNLIMCAPVDNQLASVMVAVSMFNKVIAHDREKFTQTVSALKERGCSRPAHIALMLK